MGLVVNIKHLLLSVYRFIENIQKLRNLLLLTYAVYKH